MSSKLHGAIELNQQHHRTSNNHASMLLIPAKKGEKKRNTCTDEISEASEMIYMYKT